MKRGIFCIVMAVVSAAGAVALPDETCDVAVVGGGAAGIAAAIQSGRVLAAGRCVSSDRLANSALRVEATCMATGQAAGAAAALAARHRTTALKVDFAELAALLRAHRAIVP